MIVDSLTLGDSSERAVHEDRCEEPATHERAGDRDDRARSRVERPKWSRRSTGQTRSARCGQGPERRPGTMRSAIARRSAPAEWMCGAIHSRSTSRDEPDEESPNDSTWETAPTWNRVRRKEGDRADHPVERMHYVAAPALRSARSRVGVVEEGEESDAGRREGSSGVDAAVEEGERGHDLAPVDDDRERVEEGAP